MKYERLAAYVSNTLWAIDPSKLAQIVSVLAFRAAGHEFTPEEIKARIGGGDGRSGASQRGAVAIIPIRGTIANRMSGMDASSGGASVEAIGAMIDQAAADPNVGTIVYDIDSPGGTVPGVSELASKMFALRGNKKQIAQVNDLAASAAYWLASQCDEIVSIPSGTTGSIGVFTAHQDMSKALENEGINVTLISAGKHKVEGNPFAPLSDEAKAVIQARVDEAYGQFVKDVARGRGVTPAAVRSGYGEGRALSAKDAKAAGLIDRIDTLDGTLARMAGRNPVVAEYRAMGASEDLASALAEDDKLSSFLADAMAKKLHARMDAEMSSPTNGRKADIKVMVCDCSPDCPCQNDGVCCENCATCEPGCDCIAPETTDATPVTMPMPAGPDARVRRLL